MSTFKQDLYEMFCKRTEEKADIPYASMGEIEEHLKKFMSDEQYCEFEEMLLELTGDVQDFYYKRGFSDGIEFQEEMKNIKKMSGKEKGLRESRPA